MSEAKRRNLNPFRFLSRGVTSVNLAKVYSGITNMNLRKVRLSHSFGMTSFEFFIYLY